jgi:hypothetical protein
MTRRRTFTRLLLVASLMVVGLVASTPPVAADFHLMKVEEVFAGTTSEANADFIELEMQAPDQGNVSDHPLQLFDATGARFDCPVAADVPNENVGDKILFATTQTETELGINADFTIPPMLDGSSGAACFASVDCVSWGSFTGTTPSPAGTPFPSGIPPDNSIERIGPDTNNSVDDFSVMMAQNADPNAGDLGSMTCQPFTGGPSGGGAFNLLGLKTKVRDRQAIIRGTIQPPVPGQRVKLTFFANGSPLREVGTRSATLNSSSRFKKRFKVPSDSTRCKVVVRFQDAKLGKKKFRC